MTGLLEPPFDSPLQARVYALATDQRDRGYLDWHAFLAAVDAQPDDRRVEERWVSALERLLNLRGRSPV